jgi:hypothetical protein
VGGSATGDITGDAASGIVGDSVEFAGDATGDTGVGEGVVSLTGVAIGDTGADTYPNSAEGTKMFQRCHFLFSKSQANHIRTGELNSTVVEAMSRPYPNSNKTFGLSPTNPFRT